MSDKMKKSQERQIYQLLKEKPLTRNQIESETGIRINVICWRIYDLRQVSRVTVYRKGIDPITREAPVEFLTSDPDLFPPDNQMKLFTGGD